MYVVHACVRACVRACVCVCVCGHKINTGARASVRARGVWCGVVCVLLVCAFVGVCFVGVCARVSGYVRVRI